MMRMRTTDTEYGESYWTSMADGQGYEDSLIWHDIGHVVFETYLVDETGQDLSPQNSFVDVGCAYGFLVEHLRKRGCDAWGLDISQWALEHSPEFVRPYLKQFDLTRPDMPFYGYERFELLACLETLEHIPEEHVDQALSHLYGLLKPGGSALIAVCVEGTHNWESDPTHVTIKEPGWWEEKFEASGFESDPVSLEKVKFFRWFKFHNGTFCLTRPEIIQ